METLPHLLNTEEDDGLFFPEEEKLLNNLAMGECSSPSCAALYLVHSHLLAEVSAPDKPALCCFPIHLHDKRSSHLQDVIVVTNLPGTRQLLPVAVVVKFVVAGKRNEDPKPCTQRVKDLGGSVNPNLGEKTQNTVNKAQAVTDLSLCSCITSLFML